MKRIILAAVVVVFLLSAGKTFAQVEKTVNLNITLSDVLEMTVNQDGLMTMNFDNTDKYSDGIEFTAVNQIVVKSSVGYVVTAKEGTITGTSSLPTGAVDITPSFATANNGSTADISGLNSTTTLSSSEVAVITKTSSSWNGANDANTFDVKYLVGKTGKFANLASATDNIIPVVYTATQP